MPQNHPHIPSPLATKHARLWLFTLAGAFLTLAWDWSGMDRQIMALLGNSHGFPLRNQWWLEHVLHNGAKRVAEWAFIATLAWALLPTGKWTQLSRLQRIATVTGTGLALLAISSMKRYSMTSCPWELSDFGGTAHYVSHWAFRQFDGGGGHCFPGGHASSALAFIALTLPWMLSDTPTDKQRGRLVLALVLISGLVLGLAQTLRGAHYPSHTLWTLMVCWLAALVNQHAFSKLAGKLQKKPVPALQGD